MFFVAVIYILLPVDLISDVIPVFGALDDSTLIILGLIKQYLDYRKGKEKNGV